MVITTVKRDGREEAFDRHKIINAIKKAFLDVDGVIDEQACYIAEKIASEIENTKKPKMNVEDIQDAVVNKLMATSRKDVAARYVEYRYHRKLVREVNTTDETIMELLNGNSEYWNKENSNKNAKWVTTQRDYIAGITSKDIARRFIFPENVIKAHDEGIIHIHDLDYAAQSTLHNCCLINLEDMLQNGTVVNGVAIDKPHRLSTAMTIATQVIAAVASSEYGGCTVNLAHIAPFVRDSYNEHFKTAQNELGDIKFDGDVQDAAHKIAADRTKKEISDAVQTLNYQLNSLTTTNGQSPFVSIFMYLNGEDEYQNELAVLIEEVLNQRIKGMKNKVGVYVTPAFPKLLYTIDETNSHEGTKYWYLTELAAKCTAKRMVPDYISEKIMKRDKLSLGEATGEGDVYGCMGCRSFLTPDRSGNGYNNVAKAKNYDGKPKYWGRYNIGVSTINLVDVALSSGGDFDKFWKLMDERTELCHEAQKIRAKRLSKTKAEVAPILWCDGALARLDPDETLEKLIHGGYCTSSLGYAGLYECVKYMTGESHTQPNGKKFGIKVMQFLNDQCSKWKADEDIDYSLYGAPIEATTYKFSKCLKKRFGVIEDITDRDFVTNSYHVFVGEEIDAFDKLAKEAEFQVLSPGGAISYIETSDMQNNIQAVLEVIKFIYDNIMYAELNCKSDYCQVCGYDGEIVIKTDDNGKHYFECPHCGNTNEDKMNIARRVCGYISTNGFNQGRLDDIANRVTHLDDKPYVD